MPSGVISLKLNTVTGNEDRIRVKPDDWLVV